MPEGPPSWEVWMRQQTGGSKSQERRRSRGLKDWSPGDKKRRKEVKISAFTSCSSSKEGLEVSGGLLKLQIQQLVQLVHGEGARTRRGLCEAKYYEIPRFFWKNDPRAWPKETLMRYFLDPIVTFYVNNLAFKKSFFNMLPKYPRNTLIFNLYLYIARTCFSYWVGAQPFPQRILRSETFGNLCLLCLHCTAWAWVKLISFNFKQNSKLQRVETWPVLRRPREMALRTCSGVIGS